MTNYPALQKTYVKNKRLLTRAKNSGDPTKVITAVEAAVNDFDRDGWPDQWPNWSVALHDAESKLLLAQPRPYNYSELIARIVEVEGRFS